MDLIGSPRQRRVKGKSVGEVFDHVGPPVRDINNFPWPLENHQAPVIDKKTAVLPSPPLPHHRLVKMSRQGVAVLRTSQHPQLADVNVVHDHAQ